MSKVYIVGWSDATTGETRAIHASYEGALETWNEIREELISRLREQIKRSEKDIRNDDKFKDLYIHFVRQHKEDITNLECEDPNTISNGVQATPYITEMELKI